MESYINYINSQLPDKTGDSVLYKYKRKILEEMTERANIISSRGLKDRQVVDDLVISEYPDLDKNYADFYKKEKAAVNRKRNIVFNVIGSLIYLLVVVIVFLGVSFATQRWSETWVIMVDGVLLWVVYLLSIGTVAFARMKKIFHIVARVCLMGGIMVFGVAAFLYVLVLTDISSSWITLIFALIAMLFSDAVFCTDHKHRLAIFYWLLYIPAIATFVFIICGAAEIIPWNIGWVMIPLSLILDLVLIFCAVMKNKKDDLEVADTWKES